MKQDLTGQKFGRLTVISFSEKRGAHYFWECECECRKMKIVRSDCLTSGSTKSCGCLTRFKAKDLKGQRFGYLVVLQDAGRNKYGDVLWKCRCDCGEEYLVKSVNLTHGFVKSCGCMTSKMIRDKNKGHGLCDTKLYSVWGGMKSRCYNPRNREYDNYGGRGIKVCDEWKNNFVKFYEWSMNNGFSEDLTIDRIDVDKDYSPDNCRWITNKEQQRNKRNTRYLTYRGAKKSLMEWSEITGINHSTILDRLQRNWSV